MLSLLVLATALLAVQGTFGGGPRMAERIELPSGDGGSSVDGVAGDDLLPPAHDAGPLVAPPLAGRASFDVHDAPATSPVASRIFRPPISVLA
jgi:hypothetical protein